MYVRYKKNIQENDLPRKRVKEANKIAGSGRQYLKIRCPERGRKLSIAVIISSCKRAFENKMPREGTEITGNGNCITTSMLFENKMPREGTEMFSASFIDSA